MFNFRSDKTGFIVTLILIALLVAAVTIHIIAWCYGWEENKVLLKFDWGTWWVLCIIVVLIRIAIYRRQMLRAQRQQEQTQSPPPETPPATASSNGSTPTTETPSKQPENHTNP